LTSLKTFSGKFVLECIFYVVCEFCIQFSLECANCFMLGLAMKLKAPPGGNIRKSVMALPVGLGHGNKILTNYSYNDY